MTDRDDAWKFKPGVRAVVMDDAGRVLLLLRPEREELFGGYWNAPGGGQEPGETPLAGATRELLEETGLSATYTGASMPFTFPGGKGMAYLYRHVEGTMAIATREAVEARWFYLDGLPTKMMPGTREVVAGLAGSGRREADNGNQLMEDLDLTPARKDLEAWAARQFQPWLAAHARAIARGEGLVKGWRGKEDEGLRRMTDIGYQLAHGAPFLTDSSYEGTDEEGEAISLRVLQRAEKLGRAEAARAILTDAKHGNLPPGRVEGYRDKTTKRLRSIARKNVRLIRATTEKRLAKLGGQAVAADVATLLIKLSDLHRSMLCGVNTVAWGYICGVADVLRQHGYSHVYSRTMGDDRVCSICRPFEDKRWTLRQFMKTYPLHTMCRCWPGVAPGVLPPALNWRAGGPKVVMKSMHKDLVTLLEGETFMRHQTGVMVLHQLAGPQFDKDELIKSMLAGRLPGEELPEDEVDTDAVIKSMQGAIARKQISGADPAAVNLPSGKTSPAERKPSIPIDSPDHLVYAATSIRDQLRRTKVGTPEHAHLREQYEAMRGQIKAFHKAKGATSLPAQRGETVKMPPVPTYVAGGAEMLQTPRQFEIAVAQAHTREEAMELGHYFDAVQRRGNHAGPQWDDAWREIKEAIKTMPGGDGSGSVVERASGMAGGGTPGQAMAHQAMPGDKGYGEHLGQRVQSAMAHGRDRARDAGKTPQEAKAEALVQAKRELAAEHRRLVGVARDAKPRAKPPAKTRPTPATGKTSTPLALAMRRVPKPSAGKKA